MKNVVMGIVLATISCVSILSHASACDTMGASWAIGGIKHDGSWQNQTDTSPDIITDTSTLCYLEWDMDLNLNDADGVQGKVVWEDENITFDESTWSYYNRGWHAPPDSESCWYDTWNSYTACACAETSDFADDDLWAGRWVEQYWRESGLAGWNYFYFY